MDNMRKHALSARKPNSRFNGSVARKRAPRTVAECATYRLSVVNGAAGWIPTPGHSGAAGGIAAINDAIRSAARHSGTLSLDAMLREAGVSQIIDICRSIRGAKILTVCRDHDAWFTTHIDENGRIGSDPSYTRKLRFELGLAFQHGGTFIIRQFLPLKTQQITTRGETQWTPWKQVYAFNLGNNRFEAVPVAEMRYANSLAPDGAPVSKEQRVTFCEYHRPAHQGVF
jgi:hypothetical protein